MTGVDLDKLFWLITEREQIRQRRLSGLEPLTADPVLAHLHFPNVRRELDPTTQWIREKIVAPLRGQKHMARALLICRMTNKLHILTHLRPVLLEPYHFDKWARFVARVLLPYRHIFSPAYGVRVSEHAVPIDGLLGNSWIFDNEPDLLDTNYIETAYRAVQKKLATGMSKSLPCPVGYEMALDVVGETAVDRGTWANVSAPLAEMLGFNKHRADTAQRHFLPLLSSLLVEAEMRGCPFEKAEDAERALHLYYEYTMHAAKWAAGDRRLHSARWFRPLTPPKPVRPVRAERPRIVRVPRPERIWQTATAEIAQRYQAGETSVRLAVSYGCTPQTILRHLRLRGVEIQPRGARPTLKSRAIVEGAAP